MFALFILTLRIVFFPFAISQSTSDALPCHICHIGGDEYEFLTNYTFSISDLPERCEVIVYGNYIFDSKVDIMHKADEGPIQSLVAAQKTVYIYIEYAAKVEPWDEIVDPKDQAVYNQRMCPLMQKIKELGISGIVLAISDIYSGTVPDFACKISSFITKVKEEMPTLKFGLFVSASDSYDKITKNELFDFSVTNPVLDIYIVRMFTRDYTCNNTILETGTVIKSTDQNALSLEKLSNAVSQSSMDKNKIFAELHVSILLPEGSKLTVLPYSQYCDSANAGVVCKWCEDNTQKLYDEGVFVKNTFYGVMVSWVDTDDTTGVCECQKFPATNTIFDGFDGVAVTPCAKMDIT